MAQDFVTEDHPDTAINELAEAIFEKNRAAASPDNANEEQEEQEEEGTETVEASEQVEQTEQSDPEQEDTVVEMVIDGETVEVPLSELQSSYHRHSDYTRKTMELAEQRRELQSRAQQVNVEQDQAVARMNQVTSLLQAELENVKDDPRELEMLRINNPGEYAARLADQTRREQYLQAAQSENARIEAQRRQQAIPVVARELMDRDPEFANDFKSTYQELGDWMIDPRGGGLSEEEWNGVMDSRQILICLKAMRQDKQTKAITEAQPRIRKKVKALPKVRSGAPQESGQSESRAYADAKTRMIKDSSTDAVADAFRRRRELQRMQRG